MAAHRPRPSRIALLAAALVISAAAAAEPGAPNGGTGCDQATATRAPPPGAGQALPPEMAPAPPVAAAAPARRLVVFWGVGCPHCEEARPFVAALIAEDPRLEVEWIEVRRDPEGLARFQAEARRLGLKAPGIPLFVAGDRAVVGFRPGASEEPLRAAIRGTEASPAVVLPLAGAVDPARVPFALFTVLVGLADGFNPCALYVLLVLLGILSHTGSRSRMILFGAVFVAASGLLYFAFMAAWLGLFAAAGLSRAVTMALGALLVGMGLLNLKDAVWLGRGPRLAVPEAAKPGLFRRMRAVAAAASLPAALAGIAALALLVNLVELGCTLGLPAVYTRILSLRPELGPLARHAWLALYNLAYVVPLAAVVAAWALTARRLVVRPRAARILKGVSGALLLGFGILFLIAPDLLR